MIFDILITASVLWFAIHFVPWELIAVVALLKFVHLGYLIWLLRDKKPKEKWPKQNHVRPKITKGEKIKLWFIFGFVIAGIIAGAGHDEGLLSLAIMIPILGGIGVGLFRNLRKLYIKIKPPAPAVWHYRKA